MTYTERAHLVAFVASLYPSSLERTDPSPGFEWVLYVDTPQGQLSWHIADEDLSLFPHVTREAGRTWDGTADTYTHLQRLAQGEAMRQPTHLTVSVELVRVPGRAACPVCRKRRVLFSLTSRTRETIATVARGRCADCAGMRL